MNHEQDSLAGWLAILAAVALIPEVALFFMLDSGLAVSQLMLAAALSILALRILCLSYALLTLRALLVRVLGYHGLDVVVPAIIATSIALGTAELAVRLPATDSVPVFRATILAATGVPLGVLSIVAGLRLLQLGTSMGDYGRLYAWTCIIAPICFATVVGAPLGLLLIAAGSVFLGLTLLRGGVEAPEFV